MDQLARLCSSAGALKPADLPKAKPKTYDLGWLLLLFKHWSKTVSWSEEERMMMCEAWKEQFEKFY